MSILDEIIALTGEVEAQIEQGDWLAAGELNQRRQQLLTNLLAGRAPGQLDPDTQEVLRDVLARNQATVVRLRSEQQQLAGVSQRMNDGVSAVRAYNLNAGADAGF